MFFILAHELAYVARFMNDRAKQRYGLEALDDITPEQLGELVDRLLELQKKRGQEGGGAPC